MILLLDMSDDENDHEADNTQAQYLEEVAELMRYEQEIRQREEILQRKRERLEHLRRIREEEMRLDEELQQLVSSQPVIFRLILGQTRMYLQKCYVLRLF